MRVSHLILPSLAVLALTGAASASASAGGGAGMAPGPPSPSPPVSSSGTTGATPAVPPTFPGGITGSSPSQCASTPTASATSGGAGVGGVNATTAALPCLDPTVPGMRAEIIHGLAYAPTEAPLPVQEAIWAGDRIRLRPYRVGGGHGKWNDTAYDCSGTVSYVLHAAGLLKISEDSGQMMSWGLHGLGQWITVYTNPGHAFVEIAGIRLDTSAEGDPHPPPGTGPRWRPLLTNTAGFTSRHPDGL